MRKITPYLLGAVGAATLATAGAVVAQPAGAPGGPRMERPTGPETRAEAQERATRAFARMDANGDGVLNDKDREAREAKRFDMIDTNSDGVLSREEFSAGHGKMRGKLMQRDGKGPKMGQKRGPGGHGPMMGKMANAGGQVTQAEFTAIALERFDKIDTNGDGTVSAEERKAQKQAMKAKFKERRNAKKAAQ